MHAADEPDWLEALQRPPAELPPDAPKLPSLLVKPDGTRITTLDEWKERRSAIRAWWLEVLGDIGVDRSHPPKIEVLSEEKLPADDWGVAVIRQLVRYEPEPGHPTEAYVIKPAKREEKVPGVVALHSTVDHSIHQPAGVKGAPEKFFGLKLARRGCVTISPRNYLWPDNDHIDARGEASRFLERKPQCKGMAKMLHDALVAVDILAAMEEVDAERIGSVGHSLGAKETLYLAAFDERVKVTVSSEGGVGIRFSNWNDPWYLGGDVDREGFDHEHHELLALAAPRPFLLIGGDSADGDRSWPFIDRALEVYRLYGDPPLLAMLNHKKGHSVPPEAEAAIYKWFETWL